jgi:DNA-binding NtrC family response regulator
MRVEVLIYQPPSNDFGGIAEDFQAEAGPDWSASVVATVAELLDAVADRATHHLVLVPDEETQETATGLAVIPRIHEVAQETPVVVLAQRGSVDLAARAVAAGAADFLVLGENLHQRIATLLGKLRGLFEVIDRNRVLDETNARLREALQAQLKIVGKSPQIKRLLDQIRRVAEVPRPVLIAGERGTGKELVARAIHLAGGGANRPMVTVNCAAFNDALLESELFGHEKGAFTGADAARRGKFEQADGGTLFLDEISNMSPAFQEKILRVVEYGTFTRVGATRELRSTARIIAATNRDLREQIRGGEFLPDLYDRLTFETIRVPALRERKGDIPVLAQFFLDQFARETPTFAGKRLARSAIQALEKYAFPGNIRELKNIIERAAYRDIGNEITPEDLGLLRADAPEQTPGSFQEKVDAFARRLVSDALRQAGGNQAQAARDLGLSYHQFRYYLKKYLSASEICPHCGREKSGAHCE